MKPLSVTVNLLVVASCSLQIAFGNEKVPLTGGSPPGYRQKWAIIVGIDDYSIGEGLASLRYAANDAREFRELLVKEFGYDDDHVLYLTDDANEEKRSYRSNDGRVRSIVDGRPTIEELRSAFTQWLVKKDIQSDDSILVFFAGHGLRDDTTGAGFLAAANSRRVDKENECIPVDWLRKRLGDKDVLPCRHKLVLLDCCFSGALFEFAPLTARSLPKIDTDSTDSRTGRANGEIDYYVRGAAFAAMTAGLGDQLVTDGSARYEHSLFTKHLLRGLRERANSPRTDHVFTFTELTAVIRPRIASDVLNRNVLSNQIPLAGRLESGDGDFVFRQTKDVEVPWEVAYDNVLRKLSVQSDANLKNGSPQLSLLLAAEALKLERLQPSSHHYGKNALLNALSQVSGSAYPSPRGSRFAVAALNDRRLIISGSDYPVVKIWNMEDLEGGPRDVPIPGHDLNYQDTVGPVGLVHDSRFSLVLIRPTVGENSVYVGCQNGSVWYIDLNDPNSVSLLLRGPETPVDAMDIEPVGPIVLTANGDYLRLWDFRLDDDTPVFLMGHDARITMVDILAGGSRAITADESGTVLLWDLHSRDQAQEVAIQTFTSFFKPERGLGLKPIRELLKVDRNITAGLVAPGSENMFLAHDDGTIRVYTLGENTAEIAQFSGFNGQIKSLTLSDDEAILYGAGAKGTVWSWNIEGNKNRPFAYIGHEGEVHACACMNAPDGLCSVGSDGLLRVVRQSTPSVIPEPKAKLPTSFDLIRTDDGSLQVLEHSENKIIVHRLTNGRIAITKSQALPERELTCFAAAPLGDAYVAGTTGGSLSIWNGSIDTTPSIVDTDCGAIAAVSISNRGKRVAASSVDGLIRVWTRSGNRLGLSETVLDVKRDSPVHPWGVYRTIRLTPNGRYLVACIEGSVTVKDLRDPSQPLYHLGKQIQGDVGSQPLCASNEHLCVAGNDVEFGFSWPTLVWTFEELGSPPLKLEAAPDKDNGLVLSQSLTARSLVQLLRRRRSGRLHIRVWDLDNPGSHPIVIPCDSIRKVVVSGGLKTVYGMDARGMLVAWPLQDGVLLDEARAATGRNFTHAEWGQFFDSPPRETFRGMTEVRPAPPSGSIIETPEQRKKKIEAFREQLQSDDRSERWGAVQGLSSFGPAANSASDILVAMIRDEDTYFAIEIARKLYGIDPERAVQRGLPFLVETLQMSNENMHQAALYAIAEYGREAADFANDVGKALDAPSTSTKIAAATAISRVGEDSLFAVAAHQMLQVYRESENAGERQSAVRTLGDFGSHSRPAFAELVSAALDKTAPALSGEASRSIARIGDPIVERLTRELHSVDPVVRWHVVQILGEMGSKAEGAISQLIRLKQDDDSIAVRRAAETSLDRILANPAPQPFSPN